MLAQREQLGTPERQLPGGWCAAAATARARAQPLHQQLQGCPPTLGMQHLLIDTGGHTRPVS
jgi:hypothetical protein